MSNILDNTTFRKELETIAHTSGQGVDAVLTEAHANLTEMRSKRSRFGVRAFAWLSRTICRRGYDSEYCFDHAELEAIRNLSARKSVVYLVTHKTYLDFFVLYDFFYRNNIEPPYIFGGINMAFAGFGKLARLSGAIFIRRTFTDSPIYRAVLNRYIQSLIDDGCSFSWAIEGTRSRTGKLVHPKLGLLKYVTEAARPLDEEAIAYIPVSVSYDQIPDVTSMTDQEAGAMKRPESLAWFINYIRQVGNNHGKAYLRFGEAIAISETPDAPDLSLSQQLVTPEVVGVQKLAFEVCYLINEITPATTVSLTLLSLLCHTNATREKIHSDVTTLQSYLSISKPSSNLKRPSQTTADDIDAAISILVADGVVQRTDLKGELSIVPERFLVALYYSNMAVHHFVIAAFTELGLINMAHVESGTLDSAFSSEVLRLRDLFKYEFFFSRKDQFRSQFIDELQWVDAPIGSFNAFEASDAKEILSRQPLLIAYGVLSPFIKAYQLIANKLLQYESESVGDRREFIESCCVDIENTVANRLLFSSKTLLNNGYLLAENRNLLKQSDGIAKRRKEFSDELQKILEQLDEIRELNG